MASKSAQFGVKKCMAGSAGVAGVHGGWRHAACNLQSMVHAVAAGGTQGVACCPRGDLD